MVQWDKTWITIAAHTTANSFLYKFIKVTRNITGVDNKSFPSSIQSLTCGVLRTVSLEVKQMMCIYSSFYWAINSQRQWFRLDVTGTSEIEWVLSQSDLTFWCRNYFFFNFCTPVYKMWIIQEPNKLELWNKLHFEEKKKRRVYTMFKIFDTYICWINI